MKNMNTNNEDIHIKLKVLEKENKVLKRKLERSDSDRQGLEVLLIQTRKLLETVAQERLTEEVQKQLMMFRKFVPEEFLQSLNKKDWLDVKLGDHLEHEMTVLFTDIRSFTSLSEQMTTEENFSFINNYLRYVYPPIQGNRGFVDKFIGDAIMALFYNNHDAIEAAIGMQKSLTLYNQDRATTSREPIDIGIGLHCGKLMLGIIGVENRMQSTVISDVVNLSSRLESLTKRYGSALLVSQFVIADNKDVYPNRFLGKVKVVGKTQEIEIFEVLPAEREPIFEMKLACKSLFEEGLKLYFAKQFAEASVQFTQSLKLFQNDKAAQLYLKNCANYMVNGVPDSWDGVEVFTDK
jgi:class 3 adenylate cyclase